jgi:nicotinamidase-related amidase
MTRHARILAVERSLLLVIDMQEGYRSNLHEEERTVEAAARLLRAAGALGVPVVVTEQYPKGLGGTRAEVAEAIPADAARFEKTSFSCLGAEGLEDHLHRTGRDTIVVAGIETHVCVSQTVHALLARGYAVQLPRDAVSARFPLEDAAGWAKMTGSGAVPTSVEGVVFEWLGDAKHPEFKAVHKLVV